MAENVAATFELSSFFRNYTYEAPVMKRPVIIGHFSLDHERMFYQDCQKLKFYDPSIKETYFPTSFSNRRRVKKINLDEGFKNFRKVDEQRYFHEGLKHILKWIDKNGECATNRNPNFITNRHCLRSIMVLPNIRKTNTRHEWEAIVIKSKGIIYLCTENKAMPEEDNQEMYRGYKFEHYLLSEDPREDPNPQKELLEGEEFHCVFQTQIGDHSIVFGAEMDGIIVSDSVTEAFDNGTFDQLDLNNEQFVELKTSSSIQEKNLPHVLHKFKMPNWWLQTSLVGIEAVICGFKGKGKKKCFVESIKEYSVQDIPGMCNQFWQPEVFMNFLNNFLTSIKFVVEDIESRKMGDEVTIVICRFDKERAVITGEECLDEERLPRWFTERT